MTIRVIQKSRDDFFYLSFPNSDRDVYVGGERIVVTPWLLEGVRLSELRSAAMRLTRRYLYSAGTPGWATPDDGAEFQVYDAAPGEFWEYDDDDPLPLEAEIHAGRTGVRVRIWAVVDESMAEERIATLAATAASRMGAHIIGIERAWENAINVAWWIDAEFLRRDTFASRLLSLAGSIGATIGHLAGGADPDSVVNVIEAGYPSSLVGAQESESLEAKSHPWDLDTDAGKIELAQDVARLANATGGVIVIGAATRKREGEETITKVDGIRADLFSPHRARMTIDARVYPTVEGLIVRKVPVAGSNLCVAYIRVPHQDLARQPFVVHGAIVGRRVEGSFISIVKRRGDQSLSVRPEELHTWLTVGRRLLREGRMPEPGTPNES